MLCGIYGFSQRCLTQPAPMQIFSVPGRWLILLLVLCSFGPACAQDTARLGVYLRAHRYPIQLSGPAPFSVLPARMGSRNVLILGEGDSHNLNLQDTLQA